MTGILKIVIMILGTLTLAAIVVMVITFTAMLFMGRFKEPEAPVIEMDDPDEEIEWGKFRP